MQSLRTTSIIDKISMCFLSMSRLTLRYISCCVKTFYAVKPSNLPAKIPLWQRRHKSQRRHQDMTKFSTLPSSLTHSSLNPTISSLSLYIYIYIVKTISTQLGAGSEGPRIGSRPIQTFARHSSMTIIMSRTISFHLLWLFEL